jgi:hypothetical protein
MAYLSTFIFVDAAKLESGVTINAPSTTETEKICDDTIDNDNDGDIDADDADCVLATTPPPAGTCGLSIVSGVPINYGQLNLGQDSAEQIVSVKNEGTSQTPAKIMIKAGDWISDATGNPIIFPTMITHVAIAPNLDYDDKKALSSNGWELGQISGGQSIPIYFQMKPGGAFDASLNSFTGSLHQDVTIDLLC